MKKYRFTLNCYANGKWCGGMIGKRWYSTTPARAKTIARGMRELTGAKRIIPKLTKM